MGHEVVVAVTNRRLDGFALLTRTLGRWERIFYGEFDGRRRSRVLVKTIGEWVRPEPSLHQQLLGREKAASPRQ